MCFSAPASFISSGGLILLSGASFAIAKKEDKVLAIIPFLFGVQQGLEGIQWLYLNAGSSSLLVGYGFLFFAFILWPIYVPTFVYILDKKKRAILEWFIFIGIAVALYSVYRLLTQTLTVQELGSCVSYTFNFPSNPLIKIGYALAVFVPLFISSYKAFRWFGFAIAILALISWFFFTFAFTSVWCFFAAIVSSMFFLYIRSKNSMNGRN